MNLQQLIRSREWAWRYLLLQQKGGEPNEAAKIALADLRHFCKGTQSPFASDPYETARMVGRQEVFMRIMQFLHYDFSKIYDLEEEMIDND